MITQIKKLIKKRGAECRLYIDKTSKNEKLIKIVVDTQAIDKKHGKLTLIKTAGYIVEANLKDKFYIKIK